MPALNDPETGLEAAETALHGPGPRALVAAVIDNRAGEVGLAVLDADGGALLVTQLVETTRSFAQTLTLLAQHSPEKLLVVAEAQDAGVGKATAPHYTQVPMPRKAWDDSSGLVALMKYATAEARANLEAGMLHTAASAYLAHAAAGALLRHLEEDAAGGLLPVAGSLVVRQASSEDHMQIDQATAAALELIHPIRVGTSSGRRSGMSLFRVLDQTSTKCGARLLRASLLQPLRDVATLRLRYDAVEELLREADLAANVSTCLGALPKDLDRMCGSLSLRPCKTEASMLRRIAAMIQSFILLHEALAVLPPLAAALAGAQCELLRAVGAACGHAAFADLRGELAAVLEEDVRSAKNTFLNRTQQCFAVKAGVDGFLDVARQTFCRVTEQVHELANQLRQQHRLPAMRVHYTAKKGFYFILSAGGEGAGAAGGRGGRGGRGRQRKPWELEQGGDGGEEEGSEETQSTAAGTGKHGGRGGRGRQQQQQQQHVRVPAGFSVLLHSGRSAQVTTAELNALNQRLRDASNDCVVLTEQVLEALSTRVAAHFLPLLHRLVDAVALLDMLAGFAQVAGSEGRSYVRPVLTEAGPLVIVEGRHAVLECLDGDCGTPWQPNDTYLALNSSFHIITGPNMSGKSTYLRQVALCVVMAQVGAYVPASFASLAPCDRLLSRLGSGDCLETCSSSFLLEMRELAFILTQATPRSLVLIDELGRATSTADGVGVAWAVSEQLISLGAHTLFATHFGQLTELAALYPSAKAWHLAVDASRNRLDFSWRLRPGASEDAGHYGLLLARAVGFPEEVLKAAEEVVQALDESEGQRVQTYATYDVEELAAVYDCAHKLALVSQSFAAAGGEDLRGLQKQLKRLRKEARQALTGASGLPML